MNSYLSPSGKGFGVHYDYHSVWILQLEGTKQWLYADEPTIQYPVANCVYPLDREEFKFPWYTVSRPDEATFHKVTLEPGDLLYLPTGAWHKTQADGYSLSLTMGHEPVQAAKYIIDLITASMWSDETSRRHLPVMLQSERCEGASEDAVRTAFEDALSALRGRINEMTADRLLQEWKFKARAEQKQRRCRGKSSLGSSSLLSALVGQTNGNGTTHRNRFESSSEKK